MSEYKIMIFSLKCPFEKCTRYLSYMHNLTYKNVIFAPAKMYHILCDLPAAMACHMCNVNQQLCIIMSSRSRYG